MLSKKLRQYIDSVDRKDPAAHGRREAYGVLIDVAIAITKMRKSRGLSKRELAKALNTSHPTVARWETPGYAGYTLSKLIEIADHLGYHTSLSFIPKAGLHITNPQWGNLELVQPTIDQRQAAMHPFSNVKAVMNKQERIYG